jgi:hypothetical protein
MRRRRLLVLCAAFVLVALAGGASAAPNPVERPPSLLWRTYPLDQRTAATSPLRPLRPPALAVGTASSSGDEIVGAPLLALLALLGGVMALTALVAKGLIKEGATMMAARRTRAAEPEPEEPASTEDAKPEMLVALRPAAVTAEEEPDRAESQTKTPVTPGLAPVEDGAEVEAAQSEQAPAPQQPPVRVLMRPLLRPIEEQPEVEPAAAEAEEQEAEQPRPLDAEDATEPESESESTQLRREVPPEEETEVAVETCRIRIWRGYFRYQLFVAPGGSANITGAFALSPYFKLSDLEAPGAEAMAALQGLLHQLEAEGWTVAREGQRWYSFTLERPL